jgi:hypothetical protein
MDNAQCVIQQLKHQNRILKCLSLIFASAFACFLLMGLRSQEKQQIVLSAQTFQLLDKDGTPRMKISTDPDGTPCFYLSDKDKTSRVQLAMSDKNTPIIRLLAGDGNLVYWIPRPKGE